MKKLLYLFLAITVACSSGDDDGDKYSIIGEWQLVTTELSQENPCFDLTIMKFFNETDDELQVGLMNVATGQDLENCFVPEDGETNSIMIRWEETTENNYFIYTKEWDGVFPFADATLTENTLQLEVINTTTASNFWEFERL